MADWIRPPLGGLERGATRHVAVVVWAAALVLAPRPVLAADAIPLTLTEALDVVDRQSPDLAAAREGVTAQSARADAMSRNAWPRLAVTTDWWRSDNPARVFAAKLNRGDFGAADLELDRLNDPASLSHLLSAATLEIPVEIFGKVSSRAAGERAAARALDASSQELRQDLRLRVVGAFEQARLAKAALMVATRALESARSREADVSARVEQGAALDADRLRVRARRRQREADVAGAQERWRIALAVLSRALGAPAGVVYEPGDASRPPAVLEGTLAEWQERAASGRAILAAARERRTGADMAWRAESRSLWPDVRGYAQLQDDRGPSAPRGPGEDDPRVLRRHGRHRGRGICRPHRGGLSMDLVSQSALRRRRTHLKTINGMGGLLSSRGAIERKDVACQRPRHYRVRVQDLCRSHAEGSRRRVALSRQREEFIFLSRR